MEQIFSYRDARDKTLKAFKVESGATHKDLVRAIGSNSICGYVVDKGACVLVPRDAADQIARHLIRANWTLGV